MRHGVALLVVDPVFSAICLSAKPSKQNQYYSVLAMADLELVARFMNDTCMSQTRSSHAAFIIVHVYPTSNSRCKAKVEIVARRQSRQLSANDRADRNLEMDTVSVLFSSPRSFVVIELIRWIGSRVTFTGQQT